jgi:hypothetical protein
MNLITYNNYVAGWLDVAIRDFLDVFPPTSSSGQYILITRLRGNPNPASLGDKVPGIKSLRKTYVRGAGLLVVTKELLKSQARKAIFSGFDELWLVPNLNITPQPAAMSLVGPARLTQEGLGTIGKWMAENGCPLGLGDGAGLNFVVGARGLVRLLLGYSIEQPQSSRGAGTKN